MKQIRLNPKLKIIDVQDCQITSVKRGIRVVRLILATAVVLTAQSCLNDISNNDPAIESELNIEKAMVPDEFSYATSKDVEVSLTVPEYLNSAVFSLVAYTKDVDSLKIAKATFDANGNFQSTYTVPAYTDSLVVNSGYLGLIDRVAVAIIDGKAVFDYRTFYTESDKSAEVYSPGSLKSASASGFTYMGTYNSSGVPSYLVTPDVIQQNLLDDVNASLPENKKVPVVNPEYIASGTETNIVLTKTADVWVTFVAEGAGYKNALGYYTYKVGEEPQSVEDISALNIVFPNASFVGSGGGLRSGDKVKLGRFSAGTVVAWFLVADGFASNVVTNRRGVYYSQPSLNIETNPTLKTHMVMLWDKSRETFLFGFEDIQRDNSGCDQDFNDLVFYATANPVDAVQRDNVVSLKAANDSDGDGINDELDDFPYDPNKSFNNYAPAEGENGVVAFEDLWPSKGDYDFNDLVVDYKFNTIADAQNMISTLEADFIIKNIGGVYENGFAFVLPIASSLVKNVENQIMNVGYVDLNSNRTEAGLSNAVIFVTENAIHMEGDTIHIVVNFTQSVNKSVLGSPPYNPFIVVDGNRSKEVHLPDLAPTSKGIQFLGTKDDYSDASVGRYFKTDRNLPWALNIYASFNAPPEKVSIDVVYPKFVPWANSGGTTNLDWYKN
ncbi:LruC domain-containing protein [uncultured Draconibacterium sp.]|uniref:LruC domain-containing protein n=1 Tax=uncultured Draconibacterium sp. TaxID=1573823 RepID=UPI003216A7C2